MRLILPLPVLLLLGGFLALASELRQPDFYLGGIQVNEPDHEAWVAALEDAGMNTVAVTVYAHQGDWDSANLWYDEEEPWVVNEIRVARARGLSVVLVLRVALDHAFPRNKFFWHGMIMPRTDAEVDEWFRRYRAFTRRWARVAAEEGVSVLAVASEMNALTNTVPVEEVPVLEEYWSNAEKVERESGRLLEHAEAIEARHLAVRGHDGYASLEGFLDDEAEAQAAWASQVAWLAEADPLDRINARRRLLRERWIGVIEEARREYGGPLTYAANFDQFELVDFWERLDLIGINAYFPLRGRYRPGLGEEDLSGLLEARWNAILSGLDAFRTERGIPDHRVLFTELGYVPRAHATLRPWADRGFAVLRSASGPRLVVWEDEPADPRERALAVRALYDANLAQGGDLLAGILYWKLSTLPGHRSEEPFVLLVGPEAPQDPLLAEMERFTASLAADRFRRRASEAVKLLLAGRAGDSAAAVSQPASD